MPSPGGQMSLPGSNFSARIIGLSSPKIECFSETVGIPVSQRETRVNKARCLVSFITVLKLCMLAHQTLVCIYLCTTVLIAIVHVLCWKSELMLEDELARGYFTRYDLTSVVTMLWSVSDIGEFVLLSRSSWMLIKMNDYYNTFCVACWMNLHVNCRPI